MQNFPLEIESVFKLILKNRSVKKNSLLILLLRRGD